MKVVTIIEDNPITGIRYGTIDVPEYNNNIQRRIKRYNRLRNALLANRKISQLTKHK